MSGLTDTGFEIEAVDDIRAGLEQDFRDTFYASLPLGDLTLLGHWIGIVSEQCGLAWERQQQILAAGDPDQAQGPRLNAVSAITGTLRRPDKPSSAILTLCGDPVSTINAGTIVWTASTKIAFDTTLTVVTSAALDAWVTTTGYAVGNQVTNVSRCYRCIASGVSSGGPTTTAADITDGGAHWTYLGEGTATVDVLAQAEIAGPQVAVAGDITAIQTPVTGLNSARNLLDAKIGAFEALDPELRLTRVAELAGLGSTTSDATRAAILKITGVTACTVFNNRTDTTNADGLPPHSFEVLVIGGDDQTIVDTIAGNQPDGIATFSSFATSGTHVDSEGNVETIFYTRPDQQFIYVFLGITYDPALYPSDGDTQVRDAVAALGQTYQSGSDVDATQLGSAAFTIPGVRGVRPLVYLNNLATPAPWLPTTAYVANASMVTNDSGRTYTCFASGTSGSGAGPTGTGNIITGDGSVEWHYLGPETLVEIDTRFIAFFDTSRINVQSTPVTP